MRVEPNPENPHYAKIISTQQSVASSVFSTTARINEANLRKKADDKLQRLLHQLEAEAAHS